ncbi:hypothetical protein ACNTMW_29210 [Planosporangium sp. 12N6]|uniref:hypothetical protein n=1 Tax=Planosporangium spinosum TaxID=3402278 RepID=UPI003CEE0253
MSHQLIDGNGAAGHGAGDGERRPRRGRWWTAGGLLLGAAAVTGLLLNAPLTASARTVALTKAGDGTAVNAGVPSPSTGVPSPGAPSPRAGSDDGGPIMAQLRPMLPAGTVTVIDSTDEWVRFTLDDGRGPGMIQARVRGGFLPADSCTSAGAISRTCQTLPGGIRAVTTRIADNCVQRMLVDVDHHGVIVVEVQVSSCLAWNGTTNPPGRMALTEAQALAIAADPRWHE